MAKKELKSDKWVFEQIDLRRRRPWQNEEEVRIAWVSALEQGLDIHFDAERAKKDSSYNNVIIEFKAPGLFGGTKSSSAFKEAINDRILKYTLRESIKQRIPQEDFIGIAIDGEHICFAQVSGGCIETQHLLPFSEYSVGLVMTACLNNFRRNVSAENLIEDFGHAAPAASNFMQVLSDALVEELSTPGKSKIKMLFEEWKTLYGQVADMSAEQIRGIDSTLRFTWSGNNENKMPGRLFVIHTYNSLLIKLLAAEIVSAHELTTIQSPAQEMSANLTDADLLTTLSRDIESGEIFSGAGIKGFVEEAIFSWYLDVCHNAAFVGKAVQALREILAKLSLYRTDRLQRTRDVLRDVYQDLVPGELRKSLGEFYTPDWLVELTVSNLECHDWIKTRALDPTCGSGAFLIELIRRKRSSAKRKGLSAEQTVEMLCESVWGFDLNPLAVQTARVNFLMEIADLLQPGQRIEIPVLLADAIYSPAPPPEDGEDIVEYQIGSQVAGLNIQLPSSLAFDRIRLDEVFVILGNSVEDNQEYDEAERRLIASKKFSAEKAEEWRKPLKTTYNQILTLHRNNWNGIWFRIVRNFFWSATAGQFNVVVGNPPWVRWSKLPEAYRQRVMPTCRKYDIFSKTPHHGGNELDISAMITYTTADKWLLHGGKMCFVLTQTVLQNPSSSGFRKFKIDAYTSLVPHRVIDMKAMKPFPDAANKTAVVVFEKGFSNVKYPVPYQVWTAGRGHTKSINPNLLLDEVLEKVVQTEMEAHPVTDTNSPWAILRPGRIQVLQSLRGTSRWVEGRKGITTDLNGVFFVPILQNDGKRVQIQSRPHAGKHRIGAAKTVWIEPDLLFPLIKGASDFEACFFKPSEELFTFVPNTGINKADYVNAADNLLSLPDTKRYFNAYKLLLENRSTFKQRMKNAPSCAIYNVGDFTFKPWKVIWAEMSGNFCAAVAGSREVPIMGNRPYVPDHKIYFVGFDSKIEAHYLCGLLNSTLVKEFVESHNISIQIGDIFKHMILPPFNSSNPQHFELAVLVEEAHQEIISDKREPIVQRLRILADEILIQQ